MTDYNLRGGIIDNGFITSTLAHLYELARGELTPLLPLPRV